MQIKLNFSVTYREIFDLPEVCINHLSKNSGKTEQKYLEKQNKGLLIFFVSLVR